MKSKIWITGGIMQALSAILRLFLGVAFVLWMVKLFGEDAANTFWAEASIFQVIFGVSSLGLNYGTVKKMGKEFTLRSEEAQLTLLASLILMSSLMAAVFIFTRINLISFSIGLHFLVNRLIFSIIFFKRNELSFDAALVLQVAYDTSLLLSLTASYFFNASFDNFITILLVVNFLWLLYPIYLSKGGWLCWRTVSIFSNWKSFSLWTYLTELSNLTLNGIDRIVLVLMGHESIIAFYVLARKLYEVPHNLMASQASFVFSILNKVGLGPVEIKRQRLSIAVLIYESLSIIVYSSIWVAVVVFAVISLPGGNFLGAQKVITSFIVIGLAHSAMTPILNFTYAEGKSKYIFYFSLSSAIICLCILFIAYMSSEVQLVVLSQFSVLLCALTFSFVYYLNEISFKFSLIITSFRALCIGAVIIFIAK